MLNEPIPLIILGGRDRRGSRLPEAGEDKHPLRGYKAVDLQIGGRPLIATVLDRFRDSGAFEPIFVAGPARLYQGLDPDLRVIDTDGNFADNIRAALEGVMAACPGRSVGFTTCDILPDPEELKRFLEDYRSHLPSDFWAAQIRAPQEPSMLGESAWKPQYRFVPEGETEAVATLPGHLVIVDVSAMHRDLVLRMFELAYRSRNRPVNERRSYMLKNMLRFLVGQDLRALTRFEAPALTWSVVRNGLGVARAMRDGEAREGAVAEHARRMFIQRAHRRAHPDRHGRLPVMNGLSLAKDIDTEEEAREADEKLRRESAQIGSGEPGR